MVNSRKNSVENTETADKARSYTPPPMLTRNSSTKKLQRPIDLYDVWGGRVDGRREWQYLATEDVKVDVQKVRDVWQIVKVEMKGEKWNVKDQDGVILGADTRATEGPIVADKNCEKIHFMAPNIYCCGAGTAAYTEAVTDMVSSQLKLHRYHTGRESRVVTSLTLLKSHLFSYQGYVQAALVLGGVDVTGSHLHTRDGGVNLATEAICSGIFNDLGSGSNVDVCVITKYLRNHKLPNPRTYVNDKGYSFTKKTEVLLTKITPLRERVEVTEGGDAMEE
ncbi:N-terminal nucleophile aminohydrolases (Ntn hydrolases) superfamily protein [Actinidia rufa]|uniref:N-terminal nucleophile aminohydrolases (Ntn hydrolases) superfamily protein n=1 Tax=Actinidia rufa TaxID=165716 RepID=A0A7J0FQ34_9ERIC|nr:N-terminal nucleophile aminohydrolases (Ntn hydrolases) superfamily protein [Actinidia rufa]